MKILLIGGELDGERVEWPSDRCRPGELIRFRVLEPFVPYPVRYDPTLPPPVARAAEYIIENFVTSRLPNDRNFDRYYVGISLGMTVSDSIGALISNYPHFSENKRRQFRGDY
jgi:hypothetical protein